MTVPGYRRALLCAALIAFTVAATGIVVAGDAKKRPSEDELRKRLEQLRSVPYTSFTEDEVSPDSIGVIVWDRDRAWPGYNIYCSSASPEALLLDMSGKVVHRWSVSLKDSRALEHALMLPGGDIVTLNKKIGIARIAWDSEVVWDNPLMAHHDVQQLPDGTFLVLIENSVMYRDRNVVFDEVAHLDAGGRLLDTWSTYDHLDQIRREFDRTSFLDTILDSLIAAGLKQEIRTGIQGLMEVRKISPSHRIYNYFHFNTIGLLPETDLGRTDERFAPGNLLVCARNVNQIAVLDSAMEITWVWGEGELEWPHHPTMLQTGNILVFDNGTRRGYSRVVEVNPATAQIVWEYRATPPEAFFTNQKGSAQRLPNGNTLISEGNRGRVFEVTGDGRIVWEWLNPIIKNGKRAQVYRMMRLPSDFVDPLLSSRPD
jgi:hypothetical protein